MKKSVVCLLVLLSFLLLAACGKPLNKAIVGTWKPVETSDGNPYDTEYLFTETGSVYNSGFPVGSYRIDGSTLFIEGGWGGETPYTVTIDGDTMTLEDESGWTRYTRCTEDGPVDQWDTDW